MVTYAASATVPPAVEAKDPEAVLDYAVDWSDWLETGEALVSATWTVPTGLTQTDADLAAETATVWLSGGTAGASYLLSCKVSTTLGRTDERSFRLACRER